MHWGENRVCTSCDFDLNLCEKKWRGLRYGNFYVVGTNFGNFCVLRQCHYHLREMFVCVQFDWCVWCKLLVVIRVHGICLNEVFARKRSSSGGRYLRFLR